LDCEISLSRDPIVSGLLSQDSESNSKSVLRTNQFSKTKRLLTERRALPGSGVSFDALPSSRLPVRASVWRGALSRWRRRACQPLFSSTVSRGCRATFDRLFGGLLFSSGGKHLSQALESVNTFVLAFSRAARALGLGCFAGDRLSRGGSHSGLPRVKRSGVAARVPVGNLLKLVGLVPARRAGPRR
jgi:hypothetical protein